MATSIERIDFLDHTEQPPVLIGSFFWSEAAGIRSTNSAILADLERGIYIPDEKRTVYPRDGREFFLALKFAGSSLIEVTAPRGVAEQP
jgi:hypothetical protein